MEIIGEMLGGLLLGGLLIWLWSMLYFRTSKEKSEEINTPPKKKERTRSHATQPPHWTEDLIHRSTNSTPILYTYLMYKQSEHNTKVYSYDMSRHPEFRGVPPDLVELEDGSIIPYRMFLDSTHDIRLKNHLLPLTRPIYMEDLPLHQRRRFEGYKLGETHRLITLSQYEELLNGTKTLPNSINLTLERVIIDLL